MKGSQMKFHVEDMSCGHCKKAIETAVAEAGGTATVDLDSRSVVVDGLTAEKAAAVMTDAGYTPVAAD